MPSFVDPQSIHNPSSGTAPPATWGDQVRDDLVHLYERGPYICTAATRPGSPFEGQLIFETDTNKLLSYDGSSWWTVGLTGNASTSFTPTIVQGATVTKTVDHSEYRIISGICEWWFSLSVTSAGTGATAVSVSVPVTAPSATFRNAGAGIIQDSSVPTVDTGSWEFATTTTICFLGDSSTNNYWGSTPATALASGDYIRGHIRYPVASAA